MDEPIRILQWGMTSNYGGIEMFIMNMYRYINREKVQFDFLLGPNDPPIAFEDEILSMGGRIFRVIACCEGGVRPYRRERAGGPLRIALRFRSHPSLLLPGVSHVANGLPRIGPCAGGANARRLGCPLPVFACLIFVRPQLIGRNTPHGRFSGRACTVCGRQGARGIIPSWTYVFARKRERSR